MSDVILQKKGANFFGFERVDENGNTHANVLVARGSGELTLSAEALHFSQWLTKKEITIPIQAILKVEIAKSHNLKRMWPAKVLRVFHRSEDQILVFGVSLGGKFSLTKGFKDEAFIWKDRLDAMLAGRD
ncbi:MAG: hypothetical protein CSA62_10250 [Planctomycetota bacterium]|nr:MAG: hypothetical protein CSA62_10250 [Planctomycetota bacterium]